MRVAARCSFCGATVGPFSSVGMFASLLVRLALGPLAILRVDELRLSNVPGPWDMVIWIAAMS
jgi:hypothetical protein